MKTKNLGLVMLLLLTYGCSQNKAGGGNDAPFSFNPGPVTLDQSKVSETVSALNGDQSTLAAGEKIAIRAAKIALESRTDGASVLNALIKQIEVACDTSTHCTYKTLATGDGK